MINRKFIELIEKQQITHSDVSVFLVMLKYIDSETKELILPTRELAKRINIRHDNLKKRQLKSLIDNNLVFIRDKKIYINSKFILDKH